VTIADIAIAANIYNLFRLAIEKKLCGQIVEKFE